MKEFEIISRIPGGEPREVDGQVERPLKVLEVALTTPFSHEFYPLPLFTLAGATLRRQPHLHEITLARSQKPEDVIGYVRQNRPDILALSAPQGTLKTLDDILNALAQFDQMKVPQVILGHSLPSFLPGRFLEKYKSLPITVVAGWGEDAFSQALKDRSIDNPSPDNPFSQQRLVLGTYPENYPYQEGVPPRKNGVIFHYPRFDASRGCFWGACSYCLRTGNEKPGVWKQFQPEDILKQITALFELGYGNDYFEFADEEPLGDNLERFRKVIDGLAEIKRNYPNFTFGLNLRADHVISPDPQKQGQYDEFLEKAKEIGLKVVWMGAESYSQSQLKRYTKGQITPDTNLKAAQKIHKLGITVSQGFIPYDPLVTWQELTEMAEFMIPHRYLLAEVLASPFGFLRVQHQTPYLEWIRQKETNRKTPLLGDFNEDMLTYNCRYQDPSIGLHAAYMRLIYDWINPHMKEISVEVIKGDNGESEDRLRRLRLAGLNLFLESIRRLYPLRNDPQEFESRQQAIISEYKQAISGLGIDTRELDDFIKTHKQAYLDKYRG